MSALFLAEVNWEKYTAISTGVLAAVTAALAVITRKLASETHDVVVATKKLATDTFTVADERSKLDVWLEMSKRFDSNEIRFARSELASKMKPDVKSMAPEWVETNKAVCFWLDLEILLEKDKIDWELSIEKFGYNAVWYWHILKEHAEHVRTRGAGYVDYLKKIENLSARFYNEINPFPDERWEDNPVLASTINYAKFIVTEKNVSN